MLTSSVYNLRNISNSINKLENNLIELMWLGYSNDQAFLDVFTDKYKTEDGIDKTVSSYHYNNLGRYLYKPSLTDLILVTIPWESTSSNITSAYSILELDSQTQIIPRDNFSVFISFDNGTSYIEIINQIIYKQMSSRIYVRGDIGLSSFNNTNQIRLKVVCNSDDIKIYGLSVGLRVNPTGLTSVIGSTTLTTNTTTGTTTITGTTTTGTTTTGTTTTTTSTTVTTATTVSTTTIFRTLTPTQWQDEWTYIPNVTGTPPVARLLHGACFNNGRMYIVAGNDGTSYLNDVNYLDLTTMAWSGTVSCTGTPPSGRYGFAYALDGNNFYVFSGDPNTTFPTDVHRLDLSTHAWSGALSCTGTPPVGRWISNGIVDDGFLYVFGGRNNSGSPLNDVHRLNLSTLAWSGALSCTGTPPAVRSGPTSVVDTSHNMYVYGGTYDGTTYYTDVHKLDLSTLAWSGALSCTGTAHPGSYEAVGVYSHDNKMYLLAGRGTGGTVYNTLSCLNLTTLVWTQPTPTSPPSARTAATLVLADNGRAYLFGGNSNFVFTLGT